MDFLRYINVDDSIQHEEPSTIRVTSWNVLYHALQACFDRSRYHIGKKFVGFTQNQDSVLVEFEDGETQSCGLLVCADGVQSTARSQFLPDVTPEYAGYVAWRGLVGESELDPKIYGPFQDGLTFCGLENSHMLCYAIPAKDGTLTPGKRALNVLWYRNVSEELELDALMTDTSGCYREMSVPFGGVRQEFIDEMREAASRECPELFAHILTRVEQPFIQKIVDVESTEMALGRVCLLGDAAFTTRPHAAAGAAKAAEDAWTLAQALIEEDYDVIRALPPWASERIRIGRVLVERSRDIGIRYQFTGDYEAGADYMRPGLHHPVH